MFATLQGRKRFEHCVSLPVVAALGFSLAPTSLIAATLPASQAALPQTLLPVPQPAPASAWPEAGAVQPYAARTDLLPAPAAAGPELAPAPQLTTAATPLVETPRPELPDLVLPDEPVEVTLSAAVGSAQVSGLPMTLQVASLADGASLTARIAVLDPVRRQDLSPLNYAFTLQLHDQPGLRPAGAQDGHARPRPGGVLPDSDPGASRGYIWISLDTGEVQTHMNPSGYFTDYRNAPRIDKSTNTIQNDVVKEYSFYEPSQKNKWSVTRQKGGQITVQYDLVVSGPLDRSGAAPHINGTVSFWPRKDGIVDYAFVRDGFPSAEAYLYTPNPNKGSGNTGTWQVIFQDPAIRGDPYDLFAIEPSTSLIRKSFELVQNYLGNWFAPLTSSRRSR